jgi:hypothetical protein
MSLPRQAKFSQTQEFLWSTGEKFNGAAIIGFVIPTTAGTAETVYPKISFGGSSESYNLPKGFARVAINEGKLSSELGLFYNADVTPPNTQYIHYLIDSTNKIVAGPGTVFSVTSDPITLPTLTLTSPVTTNAVAPVPF